MFISLPRNPQYNLRIRALNRGYLKMEPVAAATYQGRALSLDFSESILVIFLDAYINHDTETLIFARDILY